MAVPLLKLIVFPSESIVRKTKNMSQILINNCKKMGFSLLKLFGRPVNLRKSSDIIFLFLNNSEYIIDKFRQYMLYFTRAPN
ncbi:hypothetical protein A9498_28925 (plasmid) [Bacillus thuringiensis serovar coreanensis]|nr:hypothetical protein A9498_28925 [Bacillus thuringiensis serovar coreanensis]